jgi:hypothetical protein
MRLLFRNSIRQSPPGMVGFGCASPMNSIQHLPRLDAQALREDRSNLIATAQQIRLSRRENDNPEGSSKEKLYEFKSI